MNSFFVKPEITIELTQEDVDDIMATALEGGITYWCDEAEVVGEKYLGDWASDQISRGGSLLLHDNEEDEKYLLNLTKFLNGFKLWVEGGYDQYGAIEKGKVDCGVIDAIAADQIVQLALFNDVIFG